MVKCIDTEGMVQGGGGEREDGEGRGCGGEGGILGGEEGQRSNLTVVDSVMKLFIANIRWLGTK